MITRSRRNFLTRTALLGPAALLTPVLTQAGYLAKPLGADPISPELVKEFVRVAHSDIPRTKQILEENPHILNAAVDWGDGDFESAIGAAGHMGYRDLALYLLEKGARADIFVHTMLGDTALVKSTLEKYPHLLSSLGPHGFTLLHHAIKGGEHALELVDFLKAKGAVETHVKIYNK